VLLGTNGGCVENSFYSAIGQLLAFPQKAACLAIDPFF